MESHTVSQHIRKEAICHWIFESVIVVRAICLKEMLQVIGYNRLITYRWNFINSVEYAE